MNTQDEWLGVDAWALAGAFDELEQRAQAEQAQEAAKRLALEAEAAAERQRQEDEAREHRRLIREAGRNGRREARRKLGADVFAVNPDQIYQEWFHGGGRPSVGRVMEAIDLLCEALPPQWRPAVERIAAVPKDAAKRALWHFTDAWAALERLDAFRKQHGDALAWAMDDDEICELAERQADHVRDALGRIFNRHRVTEKTGERGSGWRRMRPFCARRRAKPHGSCDTRRGAIWRFGEARHCWMRGSWRRRGGWCSG